MAGIFTLDGDRFVPSELAGGPWDGGRTMHGGAPAALASRAIEAVPADVPMQVSRLTLELMRPVPTVPLSITTEVLRPGRKVQLVAATILADGVEVARATALRIRVTGDVVAPAVREPSPPGPAEGVDPNVPWTGFGQAMEIRVVGGAVMEPGPATVWFRLRQAVVDGEVPSPLMRVAAAADFGNGISWEMDFSRNLFINPDLTVYLARQPVGEWICLAARSEIDPRGTGVATGALYDAGGRVGTSVQALLVDRR